MSGPTHFDPRTAAPTTIPADRLARPIADEAAGSWLCCFCGLLRVYEGGRPCGLGDRNDCRECGGRLAGRPEDRAAVARCDTRRGSVRDFMAKDLF